MTSEPADLPGRIYHLALRDHWGKAVDAGVYLQSTLGKSLDDEGFIHCSFDDQVQAIADLVYRGRHDVVLLSIDPSLVPAEIRVERVGGAQQAFPHIYGSLPVDAVVAARDVAVGADGRLLTESLIGDQ